MKLLFGKTLIEKRFGSIEATQFKNNKKANKEKKLKLGANIKETKVKDSIVEYNGADKLNEILTINNKAIYNSKFIIEEESEDDKLFKEYVAKLELNLSIPPRVPYFGISKEQYKTLETRIFNEWKKIHYSYIFERNIEIWRQFWLTCERSDVIVQIIDSRNPNFFINEDIFKAYPTKKHVIFANKSDLTSIRIYEPKYDVVYYSALNDISTIIDFINCQVDKKIGFIGYPNVGKSSTINAIINKKKVSVSMTPGKTKYIQTIQYQKNIELIDCPGLVFPKHSKTNLLLNGILNVDKIIDLKSSLYEVINFIGIDKLVKYYKLKDLSKYKESNRNIQKEVEFINDLAYAKNLSVSNCIKLIIKDLFNGNIQYEKIEEKYLTNNNFGL